MANSFTSLLNMMIFTALLGGFTSVSADQSSKIQTLHRSLSDKDSRELIPSPEMCASMNQLGSDLYLSLFSPCTFTFYTNTYADTNGTFSCDGVDGEVFAVEYSKVLGWPDSCVAHGPRCYDLAAHPSLRNFTLGAQLSTILQAINEDLPNITEAVIQAYYDDDNTPVSLPNISDAAIQAYYAQYYADPKSGIDIGNLSLSDLDFSYYTIPFPSEADYVSVDCSKDYQDLNEAIEAFGDDVEPLAQALMFFGFMILLGSISCIVCSCLCCCGFCGFCTGGRRSGYTPVQEQYVGPPVEAFESPKLTDAVVA